MDYDGEFPAVGLYNVCNDYHSYETTFKIGFKYVQLEVTKAMVCMPRKASWREIPNFQGSFSTSIPSKGFIICHV